MVNGFPTTRDSLVQAVGSDDPAVRVPAFDPLVASYWKPVYRYLRLRWRVPEDEAQDLTQEFFTRALERRFLGDYDGARARFRTFLRLCLDHFLANQRKAEARLNRGGGARHFSLDFGAAEGGLRAVGALAVVDPEEYFRREWVRALFEWSVARLEERCLAEGRELQLRVFQAYDLDGPERPERFTYQALGARFGLSASQVTKHLAAARRSFRGLVLDRLREICGSDAEFAAEARDLLGVQPE